jgi:flagellar basal-body rod protein FlgB
MNGFERTLSLAHRGLDVATLRQSVIANNIANAQVPNFKRSEVNFESALKQALDSEARHPIVELERTDPKHFSNYNPLDWQDVKPRRTLDYLTTAKSNGNNVDPETEVNLYIQNQMLYNWLAETASHEFRMVDSALRV